jgi:membrane protease YdiL (CAAX protease family)
MGGALVPPWYCPWSFTNEPTILLVAAIFLLLNRWWGNIVAFFLVGYLIGYFVHLLSIVYDPWQGLRNDWKTMRVDYPYIAGSWDSQYMFALLILFCSAFFLTRGILRWRASRLAADNKSLDASGGSVKSLPISNCRLSI